MSSDEELFREQSGSPMARDILSDIDNDEDQLDMPDVTTNKDKRLAMIIRQMAEDENRILWAVNGEFSKIKVV